MRKASLTIFNSEPVVCRHCGMNMEDANKECLITCSSPSGHRAADDNTATTSCEAERPAETPIKSDSGKSHRPPGRKRSKIERVRIVVKLRKDLVDEYDLEARRRWPDKERMRSDLIEEAMERWWSVGFPRQRYEPQDWRKKREEEEREAMRDD